MNPFYENIAAEEWNDWYGPGGLDGADTVLHPGDDHGIYGDYELYSPSRLSTVSYGQHAYINDGDEYLYLQSRSGYGQPSPLVARPDSGLLWSGSLAQPNSDFTSRSQISHTFGSLESYESFAGEDSFATPWKRFGQQPGQVQLLDHSAAGSRATHDANTSLSSLGMDTEPFPPSATSRSAMVRMDPPLQPGHDGTIPRRQNPKFASDEYTARWVQGDGTDREGWCGLCSSW